MAYIVTFLPQGQQIALTGGTLLEAQIAAGLRPDAPCGGNGTCGKCKVLVDGAKKLACQTAVDRDMAVTLPETASTRILETGVSAACQPDGTDRYALAFDVGTTTVVAYLLDGITGKCIDSVSCINPQGQYGADVISRIQEALRTGDGSVTACIRRAMKELVLELSQRNQIPETEITAAAIAGNTAMHHLLLGIDPKPLVTPPYIPAVSQAIEKDGVRILPNIAGFVGGDTVGCLVSTRFDRQEALTLLIDIGTNGEMVLGNRHRRIACSTAAGPAFEGAKISCGMRGAVGAVDRVWLEGGEPKYHVIGEAAPQGLCGSGLLDLAAVLLDLGLISDTGRLKGNAYTLCENVTLTQKDVREVQLAKAAIQVGIRLLAEELGAELEDIRRVYLAGAFGSCMDPQSACRIGMIPGVLLDKITPIGNAAGEGAKLCALSREEFEYSQRLAVGTEFLELAKLPQFQCRYIEALNF